MESIGSKTALKEGLSDWGDDRLSKKIDKQTTKTAIKQEIIEWMNKNTNGVYRNKLKFDFNTSPITVDYKGDIVLRWGVDSLTNNMFQWGEIEGIFYCSDCKKLKSLEGAPRKVTKYFDCSYCDSLTNLEGSPQYVGWDFKCIGCASLKSLKGAPEKVNWSFYCTDCKSLKSLDGAPKDVGMDFNCADCGKKFTEEDVKKVSNVRRKIFCELW